MPGRGWWPWYLGLVAAGACHSPHPLAPAPAGEDASAPAVDSHLDAKPPLPDGGSASELRPPISPLDGGFDAWRGQPWNEESASIDVSCSAFFQGSMRFRADRSQLTASQIDLLAQLQVVSDSNQCLSDGLGCKLTIVEGDGTVAQYQAIQGDGACAATVVPLISLASLDPFLQTLGCRYSKSEPLGPMPEAPASGPGLAADARCFHGLFAYAGGGTINLAIAIASTDVPYHLELDGCVADRYGHATLKVLAPGSVTEVASGAAPADDRPDGTCARLDYVFPSTGTYTMTVTVDSTFAAGDFSFRFY